MRQHLRPGFADRHQQCAVGMDRHAIQQPHLLVDATQSFRLPHSKDAVRSSVTCDTNTEPSFVCHVSATMYFDFAERLLPCYIPQFDRGSRTASILPSDQNAAYHPRQYRLEIVHCNPRLRIPSVWLARCHCRVPQLSSQVAATAAFVRLENRRSRKSCFETRSFHARL